MGFFPFDIPPGVVKTDSPYSLKGRWIDSDRVHFQKGKPEKHPGWEAIAGPLTGIARAIIAYDDFDGIHHTIIGTHTKLQHVDDAGTITNITPIQESGTLTDPFSTTDTSAIVTVADTGHGRSIGDTVIFDNATAVGGITIDGEYIVATVVDTNSYTIVHSSAATSTAGPGGGTVDYQYELAIGSTAASYGLGWGIGGWGLGFWGTARTSSNVIVYPRTWSLDRYGENVLGNPSGHKLYQWDPDTPTARAALVTNSPTGNFMFVTNERYPVMLGADGAHMTLAWPDQNDITVWTPATTNTATVRNLQKGSRLIAGINLRRENNAVWSDSCFYLMRYTGARGIIYETLPVGEGCGIVGPHAFAVDGNGVAYWMSTFTFYLYAGSIVEIPNVDAIKDWLWARLSTLQNYKCNAHFSPKFNKVVWHYVADGESEPTYYVEVSLDDFSWSVGTQPAGRTAMFQHYGGSPLLLGACENSYLFSHEIGLDANGEVLPAHIESAPVDADNGNSLLDIHGYVPDFQRQTGVINLTVKTWDKPMETAVLEEQEFEIAEGQGIVDMNMAGRQMSVKLSSDELGGDFRLGLQRIEVADGPKGARR